jgi:hypothetical protein
MKHRALWTLGLGLTTLACASSEVAPSQSTPPATGNTPVNPAPTQPGGEPSVTPMPSPVVPSPPVTPPAVTPPPVVTPTEPPASAPPDGGPSAPAPTAPGGPFTCSLVVGIQATGDWFNAGFEKIVDNPRWELMAVHNAFIDYWADPKNKIWGSKPSSACTKNADNPDRVILTALSLHWEKASVEQWMTHLTAAVKNFKAKYSNLKNVELATFVRSPGDKPCPLGETFRVYDMVEQDQAYDMMAAQFPDLVTVAPKVHVDSCDDYAGHPPHLPGGPAGRAAMKMGAIYKETANP